MYREGAIPTSKRRVNTVLSYRPSRSGARRTPKKKRFLKLLNFKVALLLAISLLLMLGMGFHLYLQWQAHSLYQKKQHLLLTNARLSKKIARLKSDPSAYEEVARQKYGLIKPNERLIIFED